MSFGMQRFFFLIFALMVGFAARAQVKMDLEDVNIKGELHGDQRLKILAREKNRLRDFVSYRTNYRAEIIEGMIRPAPRYSDQVGVDLSGPGVSIPED